MSKIYKCTADEIEIPGFSKAVLTVYEVSDILRICLYQAYTLIKNNPPFTVFKIGNTYRISKEEFCNYYKIVA
jgi:hypothetical protein